MVDISKEVIVALLVITVIVSVFSTIIMFNTIDSKIQQINSASGLNRGVATTTAQVSLTVLPNPEAGENATP